MSTRGDLAMSVCPSVFTGWNFPKGLISFAGSI